MESSEYRCRDQGEVPAPRLACFETLMNLSTYARWWTLVTVTPVGPQSVLNPGVDFRFSGARPGGQRFEWSARVLEVEPPTRIEWAYTGGEYIGRTAWELSELPNSTLIAYVYRGVKANSPKAADHFTRWGTRLHTVAMREDALAGLARMFGGPGAELDDEAWRRDVQCRVAAGVRALEGE